MVRYINVPFNSAGFSTGVARMPASIGFNGVDIPVSVEPRRGAHGFLAESGFVRMVADVEAAVRDAFHHGDVPLVVGGDCPIMLGALAAIEDPGLVFIDGHEDAWQPTPDVRGEASDSELGMAIGHVRGPVPPSVRREKVLALGPRDAAEIVGMGQERIDTLVTMRDDAWLQDAHVDDLVSLAGPATASEWWLHVDLDVLSTSALGAVDYPQPGGITWSRLDSVTRTLLGLPGCRGASVGVYNPDLDRGLAAPRIADFITGLGRSLDSVE